MGIALEGFEPTSNATSIPTEPGASEQGEG